MAVVVVAAAGVALLVIAVLVKTKNIVATARTGVSVINKFAKTRNDKSNKFANSSLAIASSALHSRNDRLD